MVYPDVLLVKIWRRIPSEVKWTFFVAIVAGLFVHMYMITNKLPQFDDVQQFFVRRNTFTSGRWLGEYVTLLRGPFSMPWVIGFLTIVNIALASSVIVVTVGLKNKLNCAVFSIFMVAFPTVSTTYVYMFNAHEYSLSLLLACLAAFCVKQNHKLKFVFSTLCVFLSLSIYQAYFPVAISLLAILVIKSFVEEKGEFRAKTLVKQLCLYASVVVTGFTLYYASVVITTRGLGVNKYMNLDEMGSGTFKNPYIFVKAIKESYAMIYNIFMGDHFGFYYAPFQILTQILALASFVFILFFAFKLLLKIHGVERKILYVIILAVFPIACNFICFYNAYYVYPLMIFGSATFIVLGLYFMEQCVTKTGLPYQDNFEQMTLDDDAKPKCRNSKFSRKLLIIANYVFVCTLLWYSYNYYLYANETYMTMDIKYRHSYASAVILKNRILTCEGYTLDMPVLIVGQNGTDVQYSEMFTVGKTMFSLEGYDSGDFSQAAIYVDFINVYIGITNPLDMVSWPEQDNSFDAFMIGLTFVTDDEIEYLREQPLYPAEGSVFVLNDRIIVNMAIIQDEDIDKIIAFAEQMEEKQQGYAGEAFMERVRQRYEWLEQRQREES